MGLRVRVRRDINFGYENERKALKSEVSSYRKQHKEDFWNT
jgi:hypothetical protein